MNTSFHIRSSGTDPVSSRLFIEAGPTGISFLVLNEANCFSDLVIYPFKPGLDQNELSAEMNRVLQNEKMAQKPFKKTFITWTFPECLLVPNEWMNRDNAGEMLNLVYGDLHTGPCQSDFLYRNNIHAVYRIPTAVDELFAAHFLSAQRSHQYSLLPGLVKTEGSRLFVIFYMNQLTAMLLKDGRLQLIQQFGYSQPSDAAYHLLNLCQAHEVKDEDLVLRLCGMVDPGSNLYAGIYKYFSDIRLESLPGNADFCDEIKSLPPHFFSYLFDLALCV